MPKVYGLRIGNIGLEFHSIEDRDSAIKIFTHCSDFVISEVAGPQFREGKGTFSMYDRDPSEDKNNCALCGGSFLSCTCYRREYPQKYSYRSIWYTEYNYVCDACYAKKVREKEIFEATEANKKKEVETNSEV